LLKPEKQLELLDSFADALSLRDAVQAIYHQYLTAKKAIAALEVMAHDRFTKIDFLRYQLKEIENLHLTENEVPSLHQEHKLLNNAENIITQCEQMLQLAADGENSLSNAIYRITSILEEIKTQDEAITPISELFKHTAINLDEGNRALKNYASKLEINSERLQEIEQRLNLIHNLARKHQIKPEELPQIFVKLKNELNELEQVEDKLKNLKTSLDQLRDSYNQLAQKLTTQRTKAANKLNKLISEKMSALNMPGGKFSVNFIPQSEPTEHGLEALEFQVSANPGHPLQPLAKVASGGELSRISLAIQVAAAQNKITPTLIFDEVDVGIGGKTAEIVGQMLVTLGKITQVICITHLPQVAALGKHHLQVNKHIEKNSTVVALTPLNANERVQEIARMLGGVKITPQTIAHAKEMLVKK
jgi:DNA repair protein RecN (Recombination protein N)